MSTLDARSKLIQTLAELTKFSSDEVATVAFRQAFLDYASETPDNLESVQKIVANSEKHPSISGKRVRGLRLRSHHWLLSDVLWAAEDCAAPDRVRQEFPGITNEEWQVVCRMATVVFSLFDEACEIDT